MRAINLRTEHMRNPIGIDVKQQYLTWNCLGGKEQSAYEIQIMEDGNVVWNSGKTNSSQMYVIYDGKVKSRQRYAWKLRLWDENDQAGEWSKEAFFETGILEKREWKAKWFYYPLLSILFYSPIFLIKVLQYCSYSQRSISHLFLFPRR